ncbi:MAG TPA: UDP-glucose 4-epimerase GalE [Candidatus Limnocylindrales bacterium]
MRVLVTGGAGYIGSVSVDVLLDAGHEVSVLDSLVTGHRAAVPARATLVEGSVLDGALVERTLRDRRIDAVLHCAARALVGESVADPALYYRENVTGGVSLLDALRATGVERIVFSSSAAVYGTPATTPITEDAPLAPINPYGETKRALEAALAVYATAYGLRSVALRYFNDCGATAERGEQHEPETHVLPNMLAAIESGRPMTIFGDDYPTADGTCIRDYIHVADLADAHLVALERTESAPPGHTPLNLGSGSGFSNRQLLEAAARVTGRPVPHEFGPRRPGDPAVLVASNERAREVLGWQPRRSSLDEMVGSAWRWRQAHPRGYSSKSG